jgi:hypothetical protein
MPGAVEVKRNMADYLARKVAALQALGDHYAAKMEGEAKNNKPWKNQTGHAQQGLFGEAKAENTMLKVRLAHTVDYGVYLELANSGKFSILQPTVQKNAPQFFRDAERVLKS